MSTRRDRRPTRDISLAESRVIASATTPGALSGCVRCEVASSWPTMRLTGVAPAVEKPKPRIGRFTALPAHGEALNVRGSA